MSEHQRTIDLLLMAMQKLIETTDLVREAVRLNTGTNHTTDWPTEPEVVVDEAFLDRKIEDVDFGGSTTRIRNMLHNHNVDVGKNSTSYNVTHNGQWYTRKVETVRDLVALSEKDLLRCYNIGRLSVDRIKGVLSAHGLSLAEYKFWASSHAEEEVS